MKLQYAGDIRDFWKWRLLRHLDEPSLQICWMLTPDDVSAHGTDLRHLSDARYRKLDPELLDELSQWRSRGGFNTLAHLEAAVRKLLPRVEFDLVARSSGARLVFFDPDVGLAWSKGAPAASPQYVYADSLQLALRTSSVLVFQYVRRPDYIEKARRCLMDWSGMQVLVFEPYVWANVVFLLVPQLADRDHFEQRWEAWISRNLEADP